jgi:transposase
MHGINANLLRKWITKYREKSIARGPRELAADHHEPPPAKK